MVSESTRLSIRVTMGRAKFVVKLHSELTLATESQLDRVGVDFVFPPSQVTNNKK